MKPSFKIGAAEYEVLEFFASREEATVRQASEHFAATRKWARTTVLKTMDRLREKGLLKRQERDGVFHYRSVKSKAELESILIGRFVEETLGGSLAPFVSYLQGQADISDGELQDLKKLVGDLESRRGKKL